MTKPLTTRQDRFCHAFVHYGCGAVAARDAGYAPESSRKQGSRLLKTARVRARIGEIQKTLASDHGRDVDALIGKLEVVYRRALEDHHFYTAVRAVELQAKLSGAAALRAVSVSGPVPGARLGTNEDICGQKKGAPPLIAHAPLDIAAASGPLATTGPGPEAAEDES